MSAWQAGLIFGCIDGMLIGFAIARLIDTFIERFSINLRNNRRRIK